MNQFLSSKIIAGIVAVALLVGVGVLVSSGDTSSTTRNAALVVATPCTKPGQVTKVSKQSVVCATTNTGSLWYATMKAKGKAQACKSPGEIRKKSNIVWVCGVIKKKKLWQATQPLPPAVIAATTVIEPGATQPTPALDSTQVATPEAPVVADNTVLADTKIPEDKIVTKVIDDVTPTTTPAPSTPSTTVAIPRVYVVGETGPGGGIVFYAVTKQFTCGGNLASTCNYLEAALTDYQVNNVRKGVPWGCPSKSGATASTTGATATAIGSGKANTAKILDVCIEDVIAARVADNYRGGGKSDWFLPSKDELNELCKIYSNVRNDESVEFYKSARDGCVGNPSPTGGFAAAVYWSSSEVNASTASRENFNYGNLSNTGKIYVGNVRPVRAF